MSHKFQINLHGLIELLSDHLYSGPEVFIRELLQNAVDAIRARVKQNPDHAGEITLELIAPRGKPPCLVVTDNGIGLTEEEVHRFLATIGESSKRAVQGAPPTDYIGQFGIGILSCFVVSDEIVVLSQSAREATPAIEWRARPDGTYTFKTLEGDLPSGAQVCLTARADAVEHFAFERLVEMAKHFGGILPYPIKVITGKRIEIVNEHGAPWRQEYSSPKERTRALLAFGRERFGVEFFDAIPLKTKAGDLDGVAFVLPHEANLSGKRTHQVYLKNMLLSESADNLLPEWAFFVKAVVNANDLRPTASRETFYEDNKLLAAREALGDRLRAYLVDLAEHHPDRLQKFISLHFRALKALSVEDDDFFRLFIDYLPFETTHGQMTLGEFRKEHGAIHFAPSVDQFRQVARVAAAQGRCIVNAGYTFDQELILKAGDLLDVTIKEVEAAEMVESFEETTLEEREAADFLLNTATAALKPFKCEPDLRNFKPKEIPALFSTSREGRFFRSLEQSREIANPLFGGVLDQLKGRDRKASPHSHLCLNHANPLILRLISLRDKTLLRRAVEMLYVQALLLGHQPLNAKEMTLLNEGLMALIEMGVARSEGD